MCHGYHIWSKESLMQAENDGDLDGGQRSSEVKWGKLCAMATIFGQKKNWCKLRMMMTLMEVKGHQRSNGVNYVLWLPCLVKRSTDASWEWWWPWWRSKVIRGRMGLTMCHGYHICQKKPWCKLRMMMTFTEVKGHQRSNMVNYATKLGRKSSWCKFRMTDLHGGQRPTEVKYSE